MNELSVTDLCGFVCEYLASTSVRIVWNKSRNQMGVHRYGCADECLDMASCRMLPDKGHSETADFQLLSPPHQQINNTFLNCNGEVEDEEEAMHMNMDYLFIFVPYDLWFKFEFQSFLRVHLSKDGCDVFCVWVCACYIVSNLLIKVGWNFTNDPITWNGPMHLFFFWSPKESIDGQQW